MQMHRQKERVYMYHITENRGGTWGRAWCWGVGVGEVLTPEIGLGHGYYIARGSMLVNGMSKPMPVLLCMLHKHLLPTWLHPPNTETKQDNLDQSKPGTWQVRGTQPISRGSPTPHHSGAPGFCFLPSPYSPQQQPQHKPKVPSIRIYLARKSS